MTGPELVAIDPVVRHRVEHIRHIGEELRAIHGQPWIATRAERDRRSAALLGLYRDMEESRMQLGRAIKLAQGGKR